MRQRKPISKCIHSFALFLLSYFFLTFSLFASTVSDLPVLPPLTSNAHLVPMDYNTYTEGLELRVHESRLRLGQSEEEVEKLKNLFVKRVNWLFLNTYNGNSAAFIKDVEAGKIRMYEGSLPLDLKKFETDPEVENNGMADATKWRFELMAVEDTGQLFIKFAPRENFTNPQALENRFRIFYVGDDLVVNEGKQFDDTARDFNKKVQKVFFVTGKHLLIINSQTHEGLYLRKPELFSKDLFKDGQLNMAHIKDWAARWSLAMVERTSAPKLLLGTVSGVGQGLIAGATTHIFGGSPVDVAIAAGLIQGCYNFMCTSYSSTYDRIVSQRRRFWSEVVRRTGLHLPFLSLISVVQHGPKALIDPEIMKNNVGVSAVGKAGSTVWNFETRMRDKYNLYKVKRIFGIKRAVYGREGRGWFRTALDMAAIQWDSNKANKFRSLGKAVQLLTLIPVAIRNKRFVEKYESEHPDLRLDYNKMLKTFKPKFTWAGLKHSLKNIALNLENPERMNRRCWYALNKLGITKKFVDEHSLF